MAKLKQNRGLYPPIAQRTKLHRNSFGSNRLKRQNEGFGVRLINRPHETDLSIRNYDFQSGSLGVTEISASPPNFRNFAYINMDALLDEQKPLPKTDFSPPTPQLDNGNGKVGGQASYRPMSYQKATPAPWYDDGWGFDALNPVAWAIGTARQSFHDNEARRALQEQQFHELGAGRNINVQDVLNTARPSESELKTAQAIAAAGVEATANLATAGVVAGGKAAMAGAMGKIDDVAKGAKAGQMHHPISKRISEALKYNDNISQEFKDSYRKFLTQAADKNAHNGYWGWHEQLDTQNCGLVERPRRCHTRTIYQTATKILCRPGYS